jgi:hypothetical protein
VYRGYFLNLKRNEQRRESFARHLEVRRAAARYERFEAVDGQTVVHQGRTSLRAGELGLWLSHERLVQANRSPSVHLHIVEDDVRFATDAVGQMEAVLAYADEMESGWDLIFTEILVPIHWDLFYQFAEYMKGHSQSGAHALLDLASMPFAGLTSVFVNKRSVDKYFSLISGNWTKGQPLDLYIAELVRQKLLKAVVTVPFLTSLGPEALQSDIREDGDLGQQVTQIYRRAFFEEADPMSLIREMRALLQGIQVSPLAALYLQAAAFVLSDAASSSLMNLRWTPPCPARVPAAK